VRVYIVKDDITYDIKTNKPLTGIVKSYDYNGAPSQVAHYKDGKYHGKVMEYRDGQLVRETNYNNGLFHGIYKKYSSYNGQLEFSAVFKNGLKNGISKEYTSGKVTRESGYLNGKKEGVHKAYKENGSLAGTWTYSNDKQHGISKLYYENGKVSKEESFTNGIMDYEKLFRRDGTLSHKAIYKNGYMQSGWRYDRKGNKIGKW
jgi:antitoxin component YwqK of YwqJK toxin-antitoxin module